MTYHKICMVEKHVKSSFKSLKEPARENCYKVQSVGKKMPTNVLSKLMEFQLAMFSYFLTQKFNLIEVLWIFVFFKTLRKLSCLHHCRVTRDIDMPTNQRISSFKTMYTYILF